MSPIHSEQSAAHARIRDWLTREALPLWAGAGTDDAGGFVEQLSLDGTADPAARRRIRVQARQIYVFSHADVLGLGNWRDTANRGFEWMTRHGWDADAGGFHHGLDEQGTPVDTKRDTYDHAFILFSMAWLYRATGDRDVLGWIEKTFDYLDSKLKAPSGPGYLEGDPPAQPRRQNPHMHLLEAFLALHTATKDTVFLDRVRSITDMFEAHFFDAETGTLTEFFDDTWTPAVGDAGRLVEPGHHFEWVYLLSEVQKATGRDLSAAGRALFDTATERGLDDASGLAVDEIWRESGIKKATKRCWPQTEALRAHVVMGRTSERAKALIEPWQNRIFAHYLEPAPSGAWIDVVDETNKGCAKTIPASTFYHLMSAFTAVLDTGAEAAQKTQGRTVE